ncbi:MAG: hypothetical protein HZB16_00800 [Armatimonadetes bacterium]|nr:hypothetical protein [Armatimonadota bacterium]
MADYVGEVVLSSTTRLTAQCPDDDATPALGSFVTVDYGPGRAVAVVAEVRSGSLDPGRRPVAFGLSEEELFRQQPQLRELLSTEFEAILVGWSEGDGPARQLLPPRPPRLHRFVSPAEPDDVRTVTEGGDWLRTLLAAEASDDLLAAAVRASLATRPDDHTARLHAGRALARLVGDDYERLQVLLRRVAQ